MSVSTMELCSMHGGLCPRADFERKGKLYKTCNKCSKKKRRRYEKQKASQAEALSSCIEDHTHPEVGPIAITTSIGTTGIAKRKRSLEGTSSVRWVRSRPPDADGDHDLGKLSTRVTLDVTCEEPFLPQSACHSAGESSLESMLPDLDSDAANSSSADSCDIGFEGRDSDTEVQRGTKRALDESLEFGAVEPISVLGPIDSLASILLDGDSFSFPIPAKQPGDRRKSTSPIIEQSAAIAGHSTHQDISPSAGGDSGVEPCALDEWHGSVEDSQPVQVHDPPPLTAADAITADSASDYVSDKPFEVRSDFDTLSQLTSRMSLRSWTQRTLASSRRTWTSSNQSIISDWSFGMPAPMQTSLDGELLHSRGSKDNGLRAAMSKLGPKVNSRRKLRDEMFAAVINRDESRLVDLLATGECDVNDNLSGSLQRNYPGVRSLLELAIQLATPAIIKLVLDAGKYGDDSSPAANPAWQALMHLWRCELRDRYSGRALRIGILDRLREISCDLPGQIPVALGLEMAIVFADLTLARKMNERDGEGSCKTHNVQLTLSRELEYQVKRGSMTIFTTLLAMSVLLSCEIRVDSIFQKIVINAPEYCIHDMAKAIVEHGQVSPETFANARKALLRNMRAAMLSSTEQPTDRTSRIACVPVQTPGELELYEAATADPTLSNLHKLSTLLDAGYLGIALISRIVLEVVTIKRHSPCLDIMLLALAAKFHGCSVTELRRTLRMSFWAPQVCATSFLSHVAGCWRGKDLCMHSVDLLIVLAEEASKLKLSGVRNPLALAASFLSKTPQRDDFCADVDFNQHLDLRSSGPLEGAGDVTMAFSFRLDVRTNELL